MLNKGLRDNKMSIEKLEFFLFATVGAGIVAWKFIYQGRKKKQSWGENNEEQSLLSDSQMFLGDMMVAQGYFVIGLWFLAICGLLFA